MISQQVDENRNQHLCRYDGAPSKKAEKKYEDGKHECQVLMKARKKFPSYVYEVRFLVETDANTLVHQPNLPTNDLEGELVTSWVA